MSKLAPFFPVIGLDANVSDQLPKLYVLFFG